MTKYFVVRTETNSNNDLPIDFINVYDNYESAFEKLVNYTYLEYGIFPNSANLNYESDYVWGDFTFQNAWVYKENSVLPFKLFLGVLVEEITLEEEMKDPDWWSKRLVKLRAKYGNEWQKKVFHCRLYYRTYTEDGYADELLKGV